MSGDLTTAFVAAAMRERGYRVQEGPEAVVRDGAADSRLVRPGDLFTGFHGETTDGNLYLEQALERGATAVIGERMPRGEWPGRTIVVAPDARRAVGELALTWRLACAPRVAGITGTVGKTTAKELVAATLAARFPTHKSKENFNSLEGLPLALLSLRRGDEVSVLEMAMDRRGEIAELCEIARPDIGVVLNIGLTHVSKLGSIEAIEAEKLSLARWLSGDGVAVLNSDDPRIARGAAGLRCRVLTFGEGEGAMLRRGPVEDRGLEGTRFMVAYGGEEAAVASPIAGEHTVPAAMAAIGVALALGVALADAARAVGAADVQGRMRILRATCGATILDDRYNSSPASLEGALRMLARLPGRRIALLGRMAELGPHEAEEHRRMGEVAAGCCDLLAAVSEPCLALVEAAKAAGLADARWFAEKDEAARAVAAILRAEDHVLVKASRSQALETILPVLEGAA